MIFLLFRKKKKINIPPRVPGERYRIVSYRIGSASRSVVRDWKAKRSWRWSSKSKRYTRTFKAPWSRGGSSVLNWYSILIHQSRERDALVSLQRTRDKFANGGERAGETREESKGRWKGREKAVARKRGWREGRELIISGGRYEERGDSETGGHSRCR